MTSPASSEAVPRERSSAFLDGVCYVILTILVWGLSAFRRGLWQDDVQALGLAFIRRSHRSFLALFEPDSSPLRRLTVMPSLLANETSYPVEALQILSAATWLAMALLIGWIIGLLLPDRRLTRFVVICLTLTATSDFQTASMVPLAYNVAASCLLGAIGCALVWLNGDRWIALAASALLLASSLWNMDVAIPAVPFAVLLFVWLSGWRPTKKLLLLLAAWSFVLIPVAIVEWSFLRDPSSYAAIARVPMSVRAFAHRTISLWFENFAPWRWAFARPDWYPRPPAAISAVWMAIASIVAGAVFLFQLRNKRDAIMSDRQPGLMVLFVSMALTANAAYAMIHFSEIHYRTHILSRVWASAAIGIFVGWLIEHHPRLRFLGWAIATCFVFFGTWGGMERQDLYLATWKQHQRELSSIVNSAPAVRPGTAVLLRSDATPDRYLATEAEYLTKFWLKLLYDLPELRTARAAPDRASGCSPTSSGLDCWREGQAACVADKSCEPKRFRYEELVIMDYDYGSGTYHLVSSLRGDPFAQGFETDAARYRPEDRIIRQPWTVRQRRLLLVR